MKIFCSICKKYIEVNSKKEFNTFGHDDGRVKALAPDVGRKSARYDRAIGKY